jgi:hypothetical protein
MESRESASGMVARARGRWMNRDTIGLAFAAIVLFGTARLGDLHARFPRCTGPECHMY